MSKQALIDFLPQESVIHQIINDVQLGDRWWWQLIALTVCLLLSGLVGYLIFCKVSGNKPHVEPKPIQELANDLSEHWILKLFFPSCTALLLLFAEGVLIYSELPRFILHLSMILFTSWAVIKFIVFAIRRAFPNSRLTSSEKTVSVTIWLSVVMHLFGLLHIIQDQMQSLRLPLGSGSISLLDLIYALMLMLGMLLLALWFGSFLDRKLERMERLDFSLRVVLSRIIRTLSIILAVLFSMSALGIDLTVLSVFGGALGVGLGLGLQRIASNYVSGFIVLFERSVKIGDIVTISGQSPGWITAIRTRYSMIRTFDGAEVMVPNELLVSTSIIRQTTEASQEILEGLRKKVRIALPITITLESDVEKALRILQAIPLQHERVIEEPAPVAVITQLTSDGYALELSFSVEDPHKSVGLLKSNLLRQIIQEFKAAQINLAIKQHRIFLEAENTRV